MLKTTRRRFLKQCSMVAGLSLMPSFGWAGDAGNEELDKPYSGWREGEMDIHFINTGLGESAFLIFPDSTSMVIDAGDSGNGNDSIEKFPDRSRRPGDWIARYIQRVNPNGDQVDYFLISHFHGDHMGLPEWNTGKVGEGKEQYTLTGINYLGEVLHFKKGLDRGFPDYNKPAPYTSTQDRGDVVDNYRKFTEWKSKTDNLQMLPFQVGVSDQIILEKNRAKYPSFHTQNLYSGGIMWTGQGTETIDLSDRIVKDNVGCRPPENSLSIALGISYGPFRYFTAGDFNGHYTDENGVEHFMEEALARICGRADVSKANHHCWRDTMTESLLRSLQSRVYLANTWDAAHVAPEAVQRIANHDFFPGERLVCPTMVPSNFKNLYSTDERYKSIVAQEAIEGGHVVVKVFDSGKQYKVYYLSPKDENMTVRAVYGPYESRSNTDEIASV
ncbi:MAG: MBL fold metallo-hydrolase [Planctomycetia bacterium]|nr:MBL fold metallo-hydrolase [Planctomycetia bacterium]